MRNFEQLGTFYLGRRCGPGGKEVADDPLLYDARDLTTHAVCVGMTGSGKTGLCVTLLEEAGIDGIPAIVIDPKGDLGNLLLTFPELRASDFRPWIDAQEATRHGRTPEQEAGARAELWREGLVDWGQDGLRIARFRDAVDTAIYTPGSSAGLPLSVLRSFAAPPAGDASDPEALRERIQATVSGLLALLGVEADPVRGREHILLSTLFELRWSRGRDLDLPGLIRDVQHPPFERVGALDLESFFPASERFEFATLLNNLIASPGFAGWREGEALDVSRLLYTPEGRPRLSVLSIAHLSESERMFFVTLLLNEVVAWMRAQPGTQSLRALLYMDEIFGYLPPLGNPPSKLPMLTLLKQARAYGLGVVLATQNPVDLDYKALSNAGTWFLGRLQTERDKARVIEGLEGASAASGSRFERGRVEAILAGLGSRVFLMHNVHEDEPVLFHTRWALSYLRGPLTGGQIATLMATRKGAEAERSAASTRGDGSSTRPADSAEAQARPLVPPGIEERFLPVSKPLPPGAGLLYRPALLGVASLHYANVRANVDEWETVTWLAALEQKGRGSPWKEGTELEGGSPELEKEPDAGACFAPLSAAAARPASYGRWAKMLKSHLYRSRPLRLRRCRELEAISSPGESEGAFRVRLRQLQRERRDLELEELRKRYAPKLARLQDRIRRAEARLEREEDQYRQQKMQTAISLGSTLLGALFGRKLGSARNVGRATTTMRGAGRAARERDDVDRAEADLELLKEQLDAFEVEFEQTLEGVREAFGADQFQYAEVTVRPRKSDLQVEPVTLVWTPWRVDRNGIVEPIFEV